MGTLVHIKQGVPEATSRREAGAALRVVSATGREVSYACELVLSAETPLSSHTRQFVSLPSIARRRLPPFEVVDVSLRPGVWGFGVGNHAYYALVTPPGAELVSRARAFVELGAVEVLQALGLEDAAVALSAGDYEGACIQWIAYREDRRSLIG